VCRSGLGTGALGSRSVRHHATTPALQLKQQTDESSVLARRPVSRHSKAAADTKNAFSKVPSHNQYPVDGRQMAITNRHLSIYTGSAYHWRASSGVRMSKEPNKLSTTWHMGRRVARRVERSGARRAGLIGPSFWSIGSSARAHPPRAVVAAAAVPSSACFARVPVDPGAVHSRTNAARAYE
jgi:hypothetical protein